MARAARADGGGGGAAQRLAARRRPPPKSFDKSSSSSSSKRTPAKGWKGGARAAASGPGVAKKTVKLVLLAGAMICIGFFAVLVVDVGFSLVGKVKLGETSVVEIWQKMVDRVLDRDVPRTNTSPPPAPAPPAPARGAHAAGRTAADRDHEHERAPLPAVRPEEDARHVAPRGGADAKDADPQVQRAKQRLDDLLGRI